MELVPVTHSHGFTFTHRYSIKRQDDHVTLKIYDLFQNVLAKLRFSLVDVNDRLFQNKLEQGDPLAAVKVLVEKGQVSSKYDPFLLSQELNKEYCLKELAAVTHQCEEDEKTAETWSIVAKEGEEGPEPSYKSQTSDLLQKLSLAKRQIEDNQIVDAAATLTEIVSIDFKIASVLIKLYILTHQSQKALLLAARATAKLKEQNPEQAIFLQKQILTYIPTHWMFYTELSSLLKTPAEKAHILMKGALAAIKEGKHENARQFCKEGKEIYPESFIDRRVEFEILKQEQTDMSKELLSLVAYYEERKLLKPLVQACKMLLRLEYSSRLCQKIIKGYFQLGLREKTLKWLSIFIEKGVSVSQEVFSTLLDYIPEDAPITLWNRLGQLYVKNDQLGSARETYERAFKKHQVFEIAWELGYIFYSLRNVSKSVEYYYEASMLAGLNLDRVAACVGKINEIDPKMSTLDPKQQEQMAMHQQRVTLSTRLTLMEGIIAPSTKSNRPFISAAEYLKLFGKMIEEPPLPGNLPEVLKKQCPFFGKAIGAVQKLVFMPKGLTLDGLVTAFPHIKIVIRPDIKKRLGDVSTRESYWMLITEGSIPNSIGCPRVGQEGMLKEARNVTGLNYRFPRILEVLYFSMLGKLIDPGSNFYGELPLVEYTACKEEGIFVGGHGANGIHVSDSIILMGTGAVCRFKLS